MLNEGSDNLRVETNSKILFFGDSVTDAGRNRNTTNDIMVQKPFGDGYVDLVAGMFQGFYPQLNVHVKNAGISGNTTRDLLKRFDTDVADLKPDIIFIMIGVNDAWRNFDSPYYLENHITVEEYDKNINDIIKKCKQLTDKVYVMSPYLLDTNKNDAMRNMIDQFCVCCQNASDREGAVFINMQCVFDKVMEKCHPYVFSWDRVHPDRAAQMIIAREVMHALELSLDC